MGGICVDQEDQKYNYLKEKLLLLKEVQPDKFVQYEEYIIHLNTKKEGN